MRKLTSCVLLFALLAAGCSTSGYRSVEEHAENHERPRYALVDAEGNTVAQVSESTYLEIDAAAREREESYQRAMRAEGMHEYERGVRDTLEEFKGRRDAREGFIWEPALVEQVWVPGQVVNGAFVPGHYEHVVVRPGGWIEANSVGLPVEKSE